MSNTNLFCEICDKGPYSSKGNYQAHLTSRKHLENVGEKDNKDLKYPYNCDPCNFHTENKKKYDAHCVTDKHIRTTNNSEVDKTQYLCEECKKSYSTPGNLQVHLNNTGHTSGLSTTKKTKVVADLSHSVNEIRELLLKPYTSGQKPWFKMVKIYDSLEVAEHLLEFPEWEGLYKNLTYLWCYTKNLGVEIISHSEFKIGDQLITVPANIMVEALHRALSYLGIHSYTESNKYNAKTKNNEWSMINARVLCWPAYEIEEYFKDPKQIIQYSAKILDSMKRREEIKPFIKKVKIQDWFDRIVSFESDKLTDDEKLYIALTSLSRNFPSSKKKKILAADYFKPMEEEYKKEMEEETDPNKKKEFKPKDHGNKQILVEDEEFERKVQKNRDLIDEALDLLDKRVIGIKLDSKDKNKLLSCVTFE